MMGNVEITGIVSALDKLNNSITLKLFKNNTKPKHS